MLGKQMGASIAVHHTTLPNIAESMQIISDSSEAYS